MREFFKRIKNLWTCFSSGHEFKHELEQYFGNRIRCTRCFLLYSEGVEWSKRYRCVKRCGPWRLLSNGVYVATFETYRAVEDAALMLVEAEPKSQVTIINAMFDSLTIEGLEWVAPKDDWYDEQDA